MAVIVISTCMNRENLGVFVCENLANNHMMQAGNVVLGQSMSFFLAVACFGVHERGLLSSMLLFMPRAMRLTFLDLALPVCCFWQEK
jgi:hypothetical protein